MYGNRPIGKQKNGLVDAEIKCQKTARDCRMEKTDIRMKAGKRIEESMVLN